MGRCKLKTGDSVIVLKGKSRGEVGKILSVDRASNRAIVDGVNVCVKHRRKTHSEPGEIVNKLLPVHISNLAFLDFEEERPTRIGFRMVDGEKRRFAKVSGVTIDE